MSVGSQNTLAQTLAFRDGTSQWEVGMEGVTDSTRMVTPSDDVSLGDFFSRPIIISTTTWTPGVSPYSLTIYPWDLFFGSTRNINRLNNFKIMNSKLKIKIVINGNPFYYGSLLVDYVPLRVYDAVTPIGVSTLDYAVGASQRLHCLIDPTSSQGGIIDLPFIWPENGLDIVNFDFSAVGALNIRELVALKHANGSTTPLTINVFAWAEDMSLSIPTSVNTSALVPQASEVDMKPSSVLSATARAASSLSRLPWIGPYALATSMVANGLGVFARLFGFSRPAVITEATAMRATNIGELAVTDKKENVQRLVADSRQELTIDPSVIGVKLPDELTIAYIAGKESWIDNFPWTTSAVEGTLLFNVRVSPEITRINGVVNYLPACAFAAMPFKYWRGTMKYRFHIVCSEYHKGRLLFVYDPDHITGIEPNVNYTRIIDLENERDFTIDVAWGQPKAFLPLSGPFDATSTSPFTTSLDRANGVLGVYVLNSLNSPNSTINNDIGINVFVSACDDIDFSAPYASPLNTSAYVTQSDVVDTSSAPINMEAKECMAECLPVDNTHLVFFGEKFTSFRSLLKRYNFHSAISTGPPTSGGRFYWQEVYHDFPEARGKPLAGGLNNGGLDNFTNQTLLNYLAPAFLAMRGSIRWKYTQVADSPTETNIQVTRGFIPGPIGASLVRRIDTSADTFAKQAQDATFLPYTLNGTAITTKEINPCIEYELPFYEPYRFAVAKDPYAKAADPKYSVLGNRHIITSNLLLPGTEYRASNERYVSVGEDFQLMLFQGCPPLYFYAIP